MPNLAWLRIIGFSLPVDQILEEAEAVREYYVPHRDYHGTSQGWHSVCLHGLASDKTHSHVDYGYPDHKTAPYSWTDIAKRCPITTDFFQNQFGYRRYWRVRFMLLEKNGWIAPHKDSKISHLWAINISLNNPQGCNFYMDKHGIIPFDPGAIFMINTFHEHWLENKSDVDRYHIIVHGERDHKVWNPIIETSYAAYKND